MKKLIGILFLLVATIFPSAAFANTWQGGQTSFNYTSPQGGWPNTAQGAATTNTGWNGNTLKHAYNPVTVPQTGWTRARVNNMSNAHQDRLVCVEAWRQGTKNHLGCLRLDLNPMGTANELGGWAKEFDAPTAWLAPGNYKVEYTYQGANGMWQPISTIPSSGPFVNQQTTGTMSH